MPPFVKYILYAVIAFALGAAVAIWNKPRPAVDMTETVAELAQPAKNAVDEPAEETGADTDVIDEMLTTEPGKIVQGAPEMPAPASASASAPEEGEAQAPQSTAGAFAVGGAFTLTNHEGEKVTHQSWPGKYKLVFFGFTHCPDICPAALEKITAVLEQNPDMAEKIQPLFITTDPARDTPDIMKLYLENYHPSFVGLTGTEEEIKAVEAGYKVYAAKGAQREDGGYDMDHSSYLYLVEPEGGTVEIISGNSPVDEIAAKVGKHVAE